MAAFDPIAAVRAALYRWEMRHSLVGLICAATLASASTALPVNKASLTGAWHPDTDSCEDDLTELYSANGTYGTDNEEGFWSLRGNQLTVTVTKAGEMGEQFKPVRPPQRSVVTILRVGQHSRLERWPNGSIHRSYRCR